MADWFDCSCAETEFVDRVREYTGWTDRRVLDAFFSSDVSKRFMHPPAVYGDEDMKDVIAHDLGDTSPDRSPYEGLYATQLLDVMTMYCLEHGTDPRTLYFKGRGSEPFRFIEEKADILGHLDLEDVYCGLRSDFDTIMGRDRGPFLIQQPPITSISVWGRSAISLSDRASVLREYGDPGNEMMAQPDCD